MKIFGTIENKQMVKTKQADICLECWNDLPNYYPDIELDEFIVMPDHVHGIVFVSDISPVETIHELSLQYDKIKQLHNRNQP